MDKIKQDLKVSLLFAVYKYLKLGHPPDEKIIYILKNIRTPNQSIA